MLFLGMAGELAKSAKNLGSGAPHGWWAHIRVCLERRGVFEVQSLHNSQFHTAEFKAFEYFFI